MKKFFIGSKISYVFIMFLLLVVFVSKALDITALNEADVKEAQVTSVDNVLSDFESYHGNTNVSYVDGALNMVSTTNPGSVFFTERTFQNYEMDACFLRNM